LSWQLRRSCRARALLSGVVQKSQIRLDPGGLRDLKGVYDSPGRRSSIACDLDLLSLWRGGFWRLQDSGPPSQEQGAPVRSVAVVIPARNEAKVVGHAIRSLLEQNYAGRMHIFLVDDDSSDNTVTVARQVVEHTRESDRLTVVRARPVPNGWTGKLWALSEGLQEAAAFQADYFLLADADIIHERGNLASLVARAQSGGFEMVSLMAKLPCLSLAEQNLIPAFVFFFSCCIRQLGLRGRADARPQRLAIVY
jgi:hypothetical protein